MRCSVLVAMISMVGCGDNLQLEGVPYQYVVGELRIPSTNTEAREDGIDLNGDKSVDNQLGMIFGVLKNEGLGVGSTAQEALLRGGLVMLAELETTDFRSAEIAGFQTFLGADPVPEPCLDPARLETCGQHVQGTGSFTVDETSASDRAIGEIDSGVFTHTVGIMPVQIAIDAGTTIRLDLRGARVRLREMSEDHISGILGGGITRADIDGVVIPQAAAQMDRIVTTECTEPSNPPSCGCLSGTRARLLQTSFDANHDCRIMATELSTNSLVRSLLEPDVRIGGENLLSFGVGVELVTATFDPPPM